MPRQILTPIGIFREKNGELEPEKLFPKNGKKAAELFLKNRELKSSEKARANLEELAKKHGFKFNKFIHEFNLALTKIDLKESLSKPDYKIIQVVNALDEIEESLNLYSERLREWYNLYYPELSHQISNHKSFAKAAKQEKPDDTIGSEFNEQDEKQLKEFAKFVLNTYKRKEKLSNYLESLMEQNFPNLKAVAGAKVGAKLMSTVGGAKRLARVPSSTIQVLGAEQALFRHLKKGAKPPKHGIILNHPLLQMAPKRVRGKIARKIAGKIMIAIRRDYYGGDFIGKKLRKELNEEVQGIREK